MAPYTQIVEGIPHKNAVEDASASGATKFKEGLMKKILLAVAILGLLGCDMPQQQIEAAKARCTEDEIAKVERGEFKLIVKCYPTEQTMDNCVARAAQLLGSQKLTHLKSEDWQTGDIKEILRDCKRPRLVGI